jgi:hypothetical protein
MIAREHPSAAARLLLTLTVSAGCSAPQDVHVDWPDTPAVVVLSLGPGDTPSYLRTLERGPDEAMRLSLLSEGELLLLGLPSPLAAYGLDSPEALAERPSSSGAPLPPVSHVARVDAEGLTRALAIDDPLVREARELVRTPRAACQRLEDYPGEATIIDLAIVLVVALPGHEAILAVDVIGPRDPPEPGALQLLRLRGGTPERLDVPLPRPLRYANGFADTDGTAWLLLYTDTATGVGIDTHVCRVRPGAAMLCDPASPLPAPNFRAVAARREADLLEVWALGSDDTLYHARAAADGALPWQRVLTVESHDGCGADRPQLTPTGPGQVTLLAGAALRRVTLGEGAPAVERLYDAPPTTRLCGGGYVPLPSGAELMAYYGPETLTVAPDKPEGVYWRPRGDAPWVKADPVLLAGTEFRATRLGDTALLWSVSLYLATVDPLRLDLGPHLCGPLGVVHRMFPQGNDVLVLSGSTNRPPIRVAWATLR